MKMERSVSASQELVLKLDELCPESYRVNSPDQIRLLAISDNFQRQYSLLYPDRKPLLLCPVNECGVRKFVSLTLRPTPAFFPELFNWEGCASFVADFLSLDPLEPPVDLPRYLFSSSSVLLNQSATCFESATLLCSLLLGTHYDAYCVSGYAVREMCLMDYSLQECPLLDTPVKSNISEEEPQENKYTVKRLREMKSHFLTQLEKKKQEAEAALLQKQKPQENEQLPADPLRGLRVHCWVLVLSGSRSVRENFFIDPLSGNSYPTDDGNFLGIESVWNNFNYYANMQDCRAGCTDMVYDLEDLKLWEPLLYGATSKKQLIIEVSKKKESRMISKFTNNEEEDEQPRVFEMPRHWVSYIKISQKDLESRWPGRQKVTRYRKAKLEKFAAYLRKDGLVTRLTRYKDLDCTEVVTVKEWFHHRNDFLEERDINKEANFTRERFKRGRLSSLMCHRYTTKSTDTERVMEFRREHLENMVRRVESLDEMIEFFEGRKDFLHCRHVFFIPLDQFSQTDLDCQLRVRPIEKVVERFRRDRSKPASKDVAERAFLLNERRMELTYHLEDNRFIPSKRSFVKPLEATDKKKAEDFRVDMVSSFQVDPSEKPLKTLTLYKMLMSLMEDEKEVVLQVKKSKEEVQKILDCREQEEAKDQIHFCPWTTDGVTQARSQREEMERLEEEEQLWLQEREKDILAPLLLRLNDTETLSTADAKQIHQECLSEFKQRLVEQANLIQERYEKETQELQRKQQSFQKKQEEGYQTYCSEKVLRIDVAKKRLIMHKEAALHKYKALDQRLKRDPRLAPHLLN